MLFSVFDSLLGHFLSGFGVTFCWPGAEPFSWEPGSAVMVVMYACAVTCGRSFTVSSVWGILISFWSVLVFSPTLLSLFYNFYIIIIVFIVLLLFVITVIIISTELLALCDGCLGWGWVWRAGARGWVAGRAGLRGALATWVWGQQLQPPGSWAPSLHMRRRC